MGFIYYNPLEFINTRCFIAFPESVRAEVEKAVVDLDNPHVFVCTGDAPRSADTIRWKDRGRLDGYWYAQQFGDIK